MPQQSALLVVLIACGTPRQAVHAVVPGVPSHPVFDVTPGDLAQPNVMTRLVYRTRLAGYGRGRGRVAYRADAGPSDLRWRHHDPGDGAGLVLPVIGEARGMIRIVEDNDHARFALWIHPDDTIPTVGVAVQLADAHGMAPVDTGVWVSPGVPLEPGERTGALRAVTVLDEDLDLRGYVADTAIRAIWRATPPAPAPAGPLVRIAGGTLLRAEPGAAAAPVARVTDHAVGPIVATQGGWSEVELARPFARVRGWVATGELAPGTAEPLPPPPPPPKPLEYAAQDDIAVAPGTCFYDARDGEVIGVQLTLESRWGAAVGVGWNVVYVQSEWASFDAFLREAGTTFETCPAAPHSVSLP